MTKTSPCWIGAHGAGIDVDVRVELLARHLEAARLEQPADGGGGDALAEPRDHAPRHEDVLGHLPHPLLASVLADSPGRWPWYARGAPTRRRAQGTATPLQTRKGFSGAGVAPVRY